MGHMLGGKVNKHLFQSIALSVAAWLSVEMVFGDLT